MALQAVLVATNIAALSVTGVTLKALNAIPENVVPRDCPIIYPRPDGFMSDLGVAVDSFGSSVGKKTVTYTLVYMFLHSAISEGRGLFDVYEDMVAKATAFVDAVISNDAITGCVDITPTGITSFGPVADPAGEMFHGAQLSFLVTEFVG